MFTVPHFPARIHPSVLTPNERRSYFNVKATSTLNVAFKIFKKGRGFYSGFQSYCRTKFYHRIGDSLLLVRATIHSIVNKCFLKTAKLAGPASRVDNGRVSPSLCCECYLVFTIQGDKFQVRSSKIQIFPKIRD